VSESAVKRISILGVGLIGGSFALGLRAGGFEGEIVGGGRSEANLTRGVELGVIDRYSTDLAEAVQGADLVMLAVPMGAMRGVLEQIRPALKAGAIVTDAGSVKGSFEADARAVFADNLARVVPGHPIAGTERSGVEAAFATLYRHRRVILTPLAETDAAATDAVAALWACCGAEVERLSIGHHDRVLAATSHLPHMLAFSLVDTLATMQERDEIFRYAAGGFRDFTRIASSDPVMWRDICVANRDALLEVTEELFRHFQTLHDAIERGDADAVHQIFTRAKAARDAHLDKFGGSTE
jgi:prephenate dehydrogenase